MRTFKKFHYELIIRERHLDTFQHVNNATYLELLEEARWDFLRAQGVDLHTIHATKIGPVVLECHIKFLKELRLNDAIFIDSELITFEKKIGVIRQDIFNQLNELCASAKLTFGVFDLKARKLITPSQAWLQAMGADGLELKD